MLSIRIDTSPGRSWEWNGVRWHSGSSWIEPYDHPALETWSAHDATRTFLMVRERLPGHNPQSPGPPQQMNGRTYEAAIAEAREWAGAYHLIEIAPAGTSITTGARATAPVYLTVNGTTLHGHWDVARLRPQLPKDELDPIEVARLLALTGHYSTRTAWSRIRLLTERSTADFHDGDLTVRLPQPAQHDQSRELAADAPVIAAYEQLLDAVLADHHYLPDRIAVELSGGMDSSNVALSLEHRHGRGLASGALMQEGEAGRQQKRRRQTLIDYAGFRDTTLLAADYLPMDPQHQPATPLGPHEEIYIAGHSTLLARWKADGILWAATGVGGDEMLSLPPAPSPPLTATDVPPWLTAATVEALGDQEAGVPPAPPISDSTLRAMACGAPMYLRAGIWPLYPLADPVMWRFGQWLPSTWRQNKRLARSRLQRLEFPTEVSHPPLRENFHAVLYEGLSRFAPRALRELLNTGSPLVDGGYVDPDELSKVAYRLERQQLEKRDEMAAHVVRLHNALV
ncbi:hypothetical protein [Streptomyces sp. A30]|uniref:hypothetical protein n=1 Tax=Streptomyces sp. A30 TaxID=2789273 RepID=UPI0039800FBA